MKKYPSIESTVHYGTPIYMFDKLDGSNIRAEWDKKKGFHKFGSRNVLLDETYPFLGSSIDLIKQKYEKDLHDIFVKERFQETTCFFEFYGKESFAGFHIDNDPKTVTLFDIDVYKHGILSPKEFIKLTKGKVETAGFLYHGNVTKDIEQQIRSGSFEGITFEGVICKAVPEKKFNQQTMFKIKNQAWYDRLKQKCGDDSELYEKLK